MCDIHKHVSSDAKYIGDTEKEDVSINIVEKEQEWDMII